MINNLRMREVPNGCIIIDAQPRSQKLWGRVPLGLQTYATNQVIVLNPATSSYTGNSSKGDKA